MEELQLQRKQIRETSRTLVSLRLRSLMVCVVSLSLSQLKGSLLFLFLFLCLFLANNQFLSCLNIQMQQTSSASQASFNRFKMAPGIHVAGKQVALVVFVMGLREWTLRPIRGWGMILGIVSTCFRCEVFVSWSALTQINIIN